MTGIPQLFCFFHNLLPRHAAQVEIESHRVGDDLESLIKAAVVLAVGQRLFSIGDVQDLGSVVTIFTGHRRSQARRRRSDCRRHRKWE